MITLQKLEGWFSVEVPTNGAVHKMRAIQDAGKHMAATILQNTEPSADQSAAIRKIREAAWSACAALSGD